MTEQDASVTTSEAVTDGVRVTVRARYSHEHSDPQQSQWFFLNFHHLNI